MCAKRSVTQFCSIFLVIFFRENPPTNSTHTAFPPVHTFLCFGGSQSHHGAHVSRGGTPTIHHRNHQAASAPFLTDGGHAAGHQRYMIVIIKVASAPSPVHKVIHACRQHVRDADSMCGIDISHACKRFGCTANSVLTASRNRTTSCIKRVLPALLDCDSGKCLKFQVWSCRIRA